MGTLAIVITVFLATVSSACTDPEPITAPPSIPPAPPAPEAPAFVNFVPPDHRNVPLAPIPEGKPQKVPPVEVYGGEASLQGRLTHNGEAVAGATVQVERFVGLDSTTVQVATQPDGIYAATNIKGGRYRIRAFLDDELTLAEASTLFITEKEARELSLAMIEVPRTTKTVVKATSQPENPPVGREVKLTFTVVNQTVAPDGEVEKEELVTSRQLMVKEHRDWKFRGEATGVTGDNGAVTFTATCEKEGAHDATVEVGWVTVTIALPPCGDPNKPAPDGPRVGGSITVPLDGPIPAGTYVADDGACVTSFNVWKDDDWAGARGRARGKTMKLPDIARDLRPGEGTLGCTYERTA